MEQPYTHSSMAGARDSCANGTGRFFFEDSREIQTQLAKAMATFFLADQSKLYLTEHPSDLYAFVEDLDIEGTRTSGQPALMRPKDGDLELLKWRATALRRLFPTADLRCALYEASGWYSGSELYKESYHLIWHNLILCKEKAVLARQATIEFFEQESQKPNHPLKFILEQARRYNPYNTWDTIFDATTTRPKVGLRLPYSDKRSRMADGRFVDEHRPVLPVAELLFEFARSDLDPSFEICTRVTQVERVERKATWEWALLGMCRRAGDVCSPTYFRPPQLQRPPVARRAGRSGGPGSGSSRKLPLQHSGPRGAAPSWRGRAAAPGPSSRGHHQQQHQHQQQPLQGRSSGVGSWKAAAQVSAQRAPETSRPSEAADVAPDPGEGLQAAAGVASSERVQHGSASSASLGDYSSSASSSASIAPVRLFPNGTRASFADAVRTTWQQLCRAASPVETQEINGGLMVKIPGVGNLNYFDKSNKVVLQGKDIRKLRELVATWTDPV
ncbi:unnamed protein product [Polarella glacialis]|uniref:Uncharacterized protein n=1 Tax=Polarella glacialis TaxID=89957 RepID=A0A813EI05_POLGL|nr:unnamed protein product [Polarella glacialis]